MITESNPPNIRVEDLLEIGIYLSGPMLEWSDQPLHKDAHGRITQRTKDAKVMEEIESRSFCPALHYSTEWAGRASE